MTKIQNSKRLSSSQAKPIYDLEERTYQFAKDVRLFVKTLPKTVANIGEIQMIFSKFWSLRIGIWDLFVIWCLGFVIYYQ
ncbi:hypothetical protein D1BOALGB6SA_2202 [Olavius sp. associated proteobacterium Delta 1]|nr:hypothetical protein D1BOALGB6SA_2202 [Olavius sp. associated proteobacterium Delta 1]